MHGMGSGPTSGASMNSFTAHTERHDYLAWKFQHAIDNDDAEKFDVLSLHTGGWYEVQPKSTDFNADTALSVRLATPAPLRRSYIHAGCIPGDNFVPESVVHGCRAMPPKGPPSFLSAMSHYPYSR
ncbi:hypothetical protein CYMTET_41144 [Cymbomonas tetramitiformis]|uniref:Uncharacterized protein n=1 Tax=Cymbomonas tetramitiformis TaxID=36881 RepID=A0AAE0F295_9CHLO|nr:hypothetical protein CYMTET_41144 [Cymbomonas tetramitiformis]